MDMSFVTQMLSILLFRLPELLVCAGGLVLLWMSPRTAAGRSSAMTGLWLLLGADLAGMTLTTVQTWFVYAHSDDMNVSRWFTAVSAGHMLLTLVSAAGLALLAWGAAKAMRRTHSAPASAT